MEEEGKLREELRRIPLFFKQHSGRRGASTPRRFAQLSFVFQVEWHLVYRRQGETPKTTGFNSSIRA